MKHTADDIIKISNTLKEYIHKVYDNETIDGIIRFINVVDKNYIVLQVPEMLDHEIMEELVEDLWWMKHYDRTFFIVKPTIWVGIKNNLSDDEKWDIINEFKEEDWNPMEMWEKEKCEYLDKICGKQEKK